MKLENINNEKFGLKTQDLSNIIGGKKERACDGKLRENLGSSTGTDPEWHPYSVTYYGPTASERRNRGLSSTDCALECYD